MSKRIVLGLLIAACLVLVGCQPGGVDTAALQGTWVSTTVVRSPQPLVAGTTIKLTIDGSSIYADAGCNHQGTHGVKVSGGRLQTDPQWTSTAMGCPEPLGAQDVWVAKLFGSSPTVQLSGGSLTVSSADAEVVFARS